MDIHSQVLLVISEISIIIPTKKSFFLKIRAVVIKRGFFPILLALIVQKKIFCPAFFAENLTFFC